MWKIFKQSGDQNEGPALQKLASALEKTVAEPCLSEAQKKLMKRSLFALIESREGMVAGELESLAQSVEAVSAGSYLGGRQKKLIYQSVMARIRQGARQGLASLWLFRNWRSATASVLTLAFLLGIFVASPLDLRMTRASKWTFLEKVSGEVFINRDGRIFAADQNFGLQQGDLIFTLQNSYVSVRFLDDSVTRLGENTSLEISRLYVHSDNAVNTQVELSLLGGQVWASVYNLIDGESHFVIETENVRADVDSRASFEISSLDNTTRLAVFDNVVDVRKKTSTVPYVQSIMAGYQTEVGSDLSLPLNTGNSIVVQKIAVENDQWVQTNLALDQEHQDTLKEENKQFIADAVGSDQTLGLLADFRDNTKALFANAAVEAARHRFLDVHLGFITAQEHLVKSSRFNDFRQKATPLLIQYKIAIKEIMDSYDSLKAEDAEQAAALLAQMQEEVNLQKKALSLVLPNEPLYTAKQVVMEAGAYFARTASARANYLLDRSRNRLLEMQNLIAKNNLQDTEAIFRTYLNGLDDLVAEVEKAQVSEIEANLFALLEEQIQQLKLLTAIESELMAKNDQRLTGLVTAVKEDSMKKLVSIVKVYRKNGFPFQTVMDLKTIVTDSFDDSEQRTASLADLEGVLVEYPEYLKMKATGEVPDVILIQIEEEVIVEQEATQDVGICVSDCTEQ